MYVIIYLLVAAVRLAFSPLRPEYRLRVFWYRFLVAAFAIAGAIAAQGLMIAVHGNQNLGAIVELLIVIAIGEHLIYHDLTRRQMLPENTIRIPLGV